MCGSSGAWGNSPSPRSLNSKPMPDSSPLPFQRMNSITTGFLRAFLTSSSRVMASPARPCRPPSNVDRDLLRLTSAESPPHNSGKLNRFPQLGDTSAKYPALPPCCQVSQPIQYIFVPATPPLGSWLRPLTLKLHPYIVQQGIPQQRSLFCLHGLLPPGIEDFFNLVERHFPLSTNLGAWPDDLNPWLGEVQAGILLAQLGSFLPHCVLYLFLLFSGHGVLGLASS